MSTSSSFRAFLRRWDRRRKITAKTAARTIAPPTPPTTPPMIDFVDELRPPPLEELLSASDVDCGDPLVVLEYMLEKVLPFSVMTVVISTTEGV